MNTRWEESKAGWGNRKAGKEDEMRTKGLSLLTTAKMTKVRICWSLERFLPVWKSEHFPHSWNMIHHCSTEASGYSYLLLPFLHGPLLTERENLTSGIASLSPVPNIPTLSAGSYNKCFFLSEVWCSWLTAPNCSPPRGDLEPGGSGVLHIIAALVSSIGIRGKMGTKVRRSGKMGRRVGGEGTLHS